MILAIEKKTDFSGTTYNCGRIEGGKGANIVPDYCRFTVGVRYWTNAQYEEAEAFLRELCEHPTVAQTWCRMTPNGFYPAMEPVEKNRSAARRLSAGLSGYGAARSEWDLSGWLFGQRVRRKSRDSGTVQPWRYG